MENEVATIGRNLRTQTEEAKQYPSPAIDAHLADLKKRHDAMSAELDAAKNWKPTHNYVVFHPSNLKIVGRNGEALRAEPVDHDPFGPKAQ